MNRELSKCKLEEILPPVRRAAEDRYRRGQRKINSKNSSGAHDNSNQNIKDKEKDIEKAEINIINAENGEVDVINSKGQDSNKTKI